MDGARGVPLPDRARPRWVHHGSSISHGSNAGSATSTWPALAASLGGVDPVNLGFDGSALLDPFVARVIRDTRADLVSLRIGINLVNTDLMRLRVFVPAVASGKLTLQVIRDELARIANQRATDDPHLGYLDGLELYGEADSAERPLPDNLHPDAATQQSIGERFARRVFEGEGSSAKPELPRVVAPAPDLPTFGGDPQVVRT